MYLNTCSSLYVSVLTSLVRADVYTHSQDRDRCSTHSCIFYYAANNLSSRPAWDFDSSWRKEVRRNRGRGWSMKGEMLIKKESVKIGGETPCSQHFFVNAQEVLPTARSGSCSGLSRSVVRVAFGFFSYFSVSTDHSLHWLLANTLALFLALFLLLPVCFTCYFLSVYASLLISLLLALYSPSLPLFFCPSISYFPPTRSLLLSLSFSEREGADVKSRERSDMYLKSPFSLSHTHSKSGKACASVQPIRGQ